MVTRRRFLFRAATAALVVATTDPVEVVRRVWPGWSAARDSIRVVGWEGIPQGDVEVEIGWGTPWQDIAYPVLRVPATHALVNSRRSSQSISLVSGQVLAPGDLVRLDSEGAARLAGQMSDAIGVVTDVQRGAFGRLGLPEQYVTVQTSGIASVAPLGTAQADAAVFTSVGWQ